jgi:hypothetical protein
MRFDQWPSGSTNEPVNQHLTGSMTGPIFKTLDVMEYVRSPTMARDMTYITFIRIVQTSTLKLTYHPILFIYFNLIFGHMKILKIYLWWNIFLLVVLVLKCILIKDKFLESLEFSRVPIFRRNYLFKIRH